MASPKKKVRKIRTPLAEVKDRFGSKEALVKEIEKLTAKKDLLTDKLSEKGLERVSNTKLLRLHRLVTEVSNQFSDRGAMVDAYLALKGRAKDQPYKEKLMTFPLGRMYDMYRMAQRKKPAKASAAKG
jgi:hypothetical protein